MARVCAERKLEKILKMKAAQPGTCDVRVCHRCANKRHVKQTHVDKVLYRQELRVIVAEQLARLGCRLLRVGVSSEERHAGVVVNLDHLFRPVASEGKQCDALHYGVGR